MRQGPAWLALAAALVLVGVGLVVVALAGDRLGLGSAPGISWKQQLAAFAGALAVALGGVMLAAPDRVSLDPRRLLELITVGSLVGFLSFVIVGLPLSIVGGFRPVSVIGGTLLTSLVILRLWRPSLSDATRGMSGTVAGAALVMITALTIFNASQSSQHLIADRDPAIYNIVGTVLADDGTSTIDPELRLFEGGPLTGRFHADVLGFSRDGDRLEPQYANALPAVLALARWAGGSFLLLKANALLGGVALLLLFVFISRLLMPVIALLVTAAIGLNPMFAWFARDSYSEILTIIFLFGGLWVLAEARAARSTRQALVAGLLIGATCTARVDGVLISLGVAAYLCFEWVSASRSARSEPASRPLVPVSMRALTAGQRQVMATAVGLAATTVLGVATAAISSPTYLGTFRNELGQATDALVLLLMVSVVAVALLRRSSDGRVAYIRRWQRPIGAALFVAVLGLGLYEYLIAPVVEQRIGPDGGRTYGEEALRWIGWYAGAPTVVLGLLGISLLAYRLVRGRGGAALPLLFVFAVHAVYLWDPNITPDLIWATRRFLPVILPTLAIGTGVAVLALLERSGRGPARAAAYGLGGLALAAAILFPAYQLEPLSVRTQVPLRTETDRICSALEPNAAVLIPGLDATPVAYGTTIRAFCRVPVVMGDGSEGRRLYRRLAERLREKGKQLVVLSSSPSPHTAQNAKVVDTRIEELERTVERRPRNVNQREVVVWFSRF